MNNTNVDEELLTAENETYKCPSCGANLKYDAANSGLKCDYCGFELNISGQISNDENDFLSAENHQKWGKNVKKAHCSNCGAHNVIESTTISCNCPFCDSPMVISLDSFDGLKPDRVIPFKIDVKAANQSYQNWIKKRFYAPSSLKKDIPNPTNNSIYVPTWTYDSVSFSEYKGRLGKRYTVTVGSGKNRHTVTKIRWFRISGVHQKIVDDIVICSGNKIKQEELDKIQPFDTNNSFVFDDRFLSGHSAEHYNMTVQEGWKSAQEIISQQIKTEILRKYHYDVVDYLKFTPVYSNIKYKYVVLPIWLSSFTYKNKKYHYLINGETGKITGNYPKSIVKILLTIIFALALFITVIYFFMSY